MIIIICGLQIILDGIIDKIGPMMFWINHSINSPLRGPYALLRDYKFIIPSSKFIIYDCHSFSHILLNRLLESGQ